MPLYDFKCDACGNLTEQFAKVEQTSLECPKCRQQMRRVISTSYSVHGDMQPYLDHEMAPQPVWVKNKRHREKLMREHGVSEHYGKGWK